MSRSYKKHPIYTDGGTPGTKYAKRFANKKVRRTDWDELPLKGNGYKKVYCSWDIHDYISRMSIEDARASWERNRNAYWMCDYETFEDFLNHEWKKWYYRK